MRLGGPRTLVPGCSGPRGLLRSAADSGLVPGWSRLNLLPYCDPDQLLYGSYSWTVYTEAAFSSGSSSTVSDLRIKGEIELLTPEIVLLPGE